MWNRIYTRNIRISLPRYCVYFSRTYLGWTKQTINQDKFIKQRKRMYEHIKIAINFCDSPSKVILPFKKQNLFYRIASWSKKMATGVPAALQSAMHGPQDSKPFTYLPGVNLINILHRAFLYESVLHNFSQVTVWLCKFLSKEYRRKSC